MLLRKWTGFRSLPSRYGGIDGGFQRSSVEAGSSRLPSQESENTSGNPVSFSQSLLAAEKILPSKTVAFPSQLKSNGVTAALELRSPGGTSMKFLHPGSLRAVPVGSQPGSQANNDRIDVPRRVEYPIQPPGSNLRRRNSLSHLPNYNTKDFYSDQALARKRWSGSQTDLQANFLEETPRNVKLRDVGDSLAGQPKEFGARNLELEVDMMEFELCSLKQKMESSYAYLEKERKWLEVIRSEGRTRKGELDDKIFKIEMELAKTRSYFGKRDHHLLPQGFGQSEHVTQETLDVGQELRNLQESLSALKNCIKTLEEKRNEMVQQLKCVKEGEQSSASHPTATASLETKRERRQLQAAYKNIKQKNVALLQQVQHLSLELKHAQKNQEESGDQISALKSELASNKNQANQQEEEKVLMKEEMESVRQSNEELSSTAAESCQRLEALLEKLHLLEEEKKSQANHIQALEDERTRLLEEKEQHLLERMVEQQGQEESRKALQASCENLRESQIQLQKEKDLLQVHCQDLERQVEELGKQLDEEQSISQEWRNRWKEVDAALKTKGEELEKMRAQNQALQAKNAEWSLEKQRLQQLVRVSEEQLAEKDQALRDLRQTRDVERAALETRTSPEPKITREGPGTSYEGRPGGLEAKIVGNQLEDLRLQHHSVTEQLKELFRQRQQPEAGARKHQDGGLKEKNSTAPQNVPRALTTSQESLGFSSEESRLESGDASKRGEEEQSLRQQLEAKNDVISAMACEIQTLKEKNENLMQAKLRFQEQIQHIRQLSKRKESEKSHQELQVPRFPTGPGDDARKDRCHEIPEVSSRKDEAPSSSHHVEIPEQLQACPEEEQKDTSSNIRMARRGPLLLPPDASLQPPGTLSDTSSASDKLFLAPLALLKHVEEEGALLRPHSPGLLSPKPFGPPRPWSPFRERAESPENRREV
ncbi:interaptin-like isoform X2 [Pantherophis guttatus]|uniref:Interaptin-like isoform X2 n=1 Tax=Pantherophis guttatus TaxID=94885 RepID=A0ABM3ZAP4_PANGU|nr:interaptin-like isoform X2 [Pantherophis guttatus]